jgi:hypothetical protein
MPPRRFPPPWSVEETDVNEKAIARIEEEVLSYDVSDEALEAAGTQTEIAGARTFVCTGIQCNLVPNIEQ